MVVVFVLLLLIVAGPAVAGAQTTTGTTTPAPGSEFNPRTPPAPTIHSGSEIVFPVPPPPAARPVQLFEFHPLAGVSEEYTDNFNRVVRNRTENFRSSVSPGMSVQMDAGTVTGLATYTISGFHDSSLDELGYFNVVAGRLSWDATPRLKLTATGGLNQSDAPGQADRLGLRIERRKFTGAHGSLNADWAIDNVTVSPYYRLSLFSEENGADTTSHTFGLSTSVTLFRIHTLTLGYEHLMSETSASSGPGTASETNGHQFTAAFSRDVSERASVGITGSYAFRTQDEQRPDAETNFRRWAAGVFANYFIPGTIALRLNVGASQLTTDRSDFQPVVSTSSSLSYWFGQAVVGVSFERGYSETFAEGQNQGVVLTTGGSVSLSYPFTPAFGGTVNIAYRENEFTGIGGAPTALAAGGSSTRTDKVLTGTIGVSYQILRWLGASLDYSYSLTDSSDVDGEIKENRVRLALNFAF
jgi:hypothetical protein